METLGKMGWVLFVQPKRNIQLTAAEVSQLWSGYVNDSLGNRLLKHFRQHATDPKAKAIVEYALNLTEKHMGKLTSFFERDGHPVPAGFTDEDVDLNAPRLYADSLVLQYLKNMGTLGMSFYTLAIAVCSRGDVVDYFSECLASSTELHNRSLQLLLEQGTYVRPPYIPVPEQVEYVQKQSFLNGFFGDRRPLNAVEINQLFFNMITNMLGQALMTGFAQTARSEEIANYIRRGREIASKHVQVFAELLKDDGLSAPGTWVTHVTDSTVPPVSDKLMLQNTTFLIAAGIGNYGVSTSLCMRRDLSAAYVRLMAECGKFAEDGANLLIERGWLEKIPGSVDRDALMKA